MKRLTIAQIKSMHSALILTTGGMDGIRDEGLLDSAVSNPFQTFDGNYLYPTLQAKAAQLGFSLVKDHPFIDGNKRIGILVMLVFLEINGLFVHSTDEELVALGLGLADGSITSNALQIWIFEHS